MYVYIDYTIKIEQDFLTYNTMVLTLDGKSEINAHVYRVKQEIVSVKGF